METIEEDISGLDPFLTRDASGHIKEFKHRHSMRLSLFPFNTKMENALYLRLKEDLKSFDGVIGHCYRLIQHKEFPQSLRNVNTFKEELNRQILTTVTEKTNCDETLKLKLHSIINSLFFRDKNLVKYGPKALGYMNWNHYDPTLIKKSEFFKSIFFSKHLENLFTNEEIISDNNIIQLINDSLPKLTNIDEVRAEKQYFNLDPIVSTLFEQDFKFLTDDQKYFLNDANKLFKYYYFFYITRSAYYLNDFFVYKEHPLFFTFEEESVSHSRRTYDLGWKQAEPKIENLFSHAVCLDLINHIPSLGSIKYDYKGLTKFFCQANQPLQNSLLKELRTVIDTYIRYVTTDDDWNNFHSFLCRKLDQHPPENEFEKLVIDLWCRIEYQFLHSNRKKPRKSFANWFIKFCEINFLKSRGRNGYSLSLTQDMLLFITKLCIGGKDKIRLKDLWLEFTKRGINFDGATQKVIIEIYQNINLLENKSDSGDAQYVRSFL